MRVIWRLFEIHTIRPTKVIYFFSKRLEQQPRRAIDERNVGDEIRINIEICAERPDEIGYGVVDLG